MSQFRHAFLLTLSALLCGAPLAGATELGEPAVRSHSGQNLIADIELTGMSDPAVPVLVRPASADVYRGANIALSPVLKSLQLSVMRRDGRQFLHIISTTPVQAGHVNLFLELNDGGRRDVRAVTLWLTPEPPAPPAPPAPVPVAPPPPPVAVAPAPVPKPAVMPAPALARALPAAPAACPKISQEELRTCAALDYKNGMLQARIVELEEKVKALQLALDEGALAKPATAPVKPTATPAPPKPKPKKKVERFPWLLVIGVALGVGFITWLVVFLRRKKAQLKGVPPPEPGPSLLARLRGRFKRKNKTEEGAPPPAD